MPHFFFQVCLTKTTESCLGWTEIQRDEPWIANTSQLLFLMKDLCFFHLNINPSILQKFEELMSQDVECTFVARKQQVWSIWNVRLTKVLKVEWGEQVSEF